MGGVSQERRSTVSSVPGGMRHLCLSGHLRGSLHLVPDDPSPSLLTLPVFRKLPFPSSLSAL